MGNFTWLKTMADERYKHRGTRGFEAMSRLAGEFAKKVTDAAAGAYREFESSGAEDDNGGAPRVTAESARAFIFEKLAGSAEALRLDPDDVLHFLRHRAEDYWLILMTRWESVSRDVVDELLSEAAQRQSKGNAGKLLWSSLERWEGVARFVVEKVVDTSMGLATAQNRPEGEPKRAEPSAAKPQGGYPQGPSWMRSAEETTDEGSDEDGPWMFD